MKISYNWLKEFITINLSPQEVADILTNIGLEVESLDVSTPIPGGLEGLIVGYVKSVEKHSNADKLSITKVDVGFDEELQIVCGASNVEVGQKVIVAVVGTIVYPVKSEPFKITKSKIRGELSEGMICAEDEIGLGTSHEGIMVLDSDAPVGMLVKEYLKLEDDYVFEIGLTPNRADAASHLGVARDLAAYLKSNVQLPHTTISPQKEMTLPIQVEVKDTEACLRYSGVSVVGVTIKESPDWLKNRLKSIGVKPINNVVDITNYVCHGLGQPMHAFDADKIIGNKIIVQRSNAAESFKTLDEIERKLSSEDLMICNEKEAMCIAGVFGGINSGVVDRTQNIFLESACFHPSTVRKTAKRHGLKTDASFRFERGTDPEITLFALKYTAQLILELAGGHLGSDWIDIYPTPIKKAKVIVDFERVNKLIGKQIDKKEIQSILHSLGMKFLSENENQLEVEVPTSKVDVTRECDIVEEILRIYGFNNVEMPSQVRSSLSFSVKPDEDRIQDILSNTLTGLGFYEIMSNSLTTSSYTKWTNSATQVSILNPLSNELDVLRQTLLFSGLEAIAYNQNRKATDLKLFEYGVTYQKLGKNYNEEQHLALFITGNRQPEQWNSNSGNVDFYDLKAYVDLVLNRLGVADLLELGKCSNTSFKEGISYVKDAKTYVELGSVKAELLKQLDITSEVYYADFSWDLILNELRKHTNVYTGIPKSLIVRRDLSMLLDKEVTFDQLEKIAQNTDNKILRKVSVFDVYEGDKLPQGKKSYALSFILQDDEKTLNDKQIDAVMDKLIRNYETQVKAEIRRN